MNILKSHEIYSSLKDFERFQGILEAKIPFAAMAQV